MPRTVTEMRVSSQNVKKNVDVLGKVNLSLGIPKSSERSRIRPTLLRAIVILRFT